MRVEIRRYLLLIIALSTALISVGRAPAETPAATAPHTTTLIVYAARQLPEGEWTALLDALRRGAALAAEQTPELRGGFEVVRGDTIPRGGLLVDFPVVINLHGDCRLALRPVTASGGTLGWVPSRHGHIEPFVHVNCTRLVEMLSPMALNMTQNRRNTVMGEAITRVIIHEWIHIATQSPKHAKRGVEKSQFGVMDLLADDEQMQRLHAGHGKKRRSRNHDS